MNEIIKVNEETMTVSARDLHEKLEIGTRFNDWFPRMCEYGFADGIDFYSNLSKTTETGGRPATDYELTTKNGEPQITTKTLVYQKGVDKIRKLLDERGKKRTF